MYQQRIVIVGAGIIGLSTAYSLLKRGCKHVTVLEQAEVDHKRGTSHGISRLLRFEYGPDLLYSKMVELSLKRWRNLEFVAGQSLYTRTGLLALGTEQDNFTRPSYHLLRELGCSIQRLSRASCNDRFPQFNTQPYDMITYNEDAGMLHASTCLRTLRELIIDLGGHIYEGHRVNSILHENHMRPIGLRLSSGDEINADRVVMAVGPWVHRLLGDLRLPIRMTRQYLLYFAHLPLSSFGLPAFPAFTADDLYGFPIHNTCTGGKGPCWFKAASHAFGAPVDPDEVPLFDNRVIEQITRQLYTLLPALRQAELAHVDACMYDVSPDGDFVLDYLPDDSRIVFATGLTGHAFKFAPVLSEILSSLLHHTEPPVPLDRFKLARFAEHISPARSSVA